MPIKKKLTEEEHALYEILRHPVWCGEFLHELDTSTDIIFEYTEYQKEFLCDFNPRVSICAGRAVGKTLSIIDKLVWVTLNTFWKESAVYTVPNRTQLEPVFLRLTNWYRKHPLLKHYTGRSGINSQSYIIKLKNGAVIDCRIAGQSGTGANVVGLHVPFIIVDEAELYSWGTWIELLPTLNTWQQGFQLIVSGVPTGVREKNVLFYVDQRDDSFSKHRISAHLNPRYTQEDEERNIKQFGGVDNENYVHLVLGKHGTPAYSLFDRARMAFDDHDVFIGTVFGQKIKSDPLYLQRLYSTLPPLPENTTNTMFGIDLGYVDPTVIHVYFKTTAVPKWRIHARITARQVPYPTQETMIDAIDTIYHPQIIGMDEGNAGKSVVQHLKSDSMYKHKNYKQRLIPIQFRSSVTIGYNSDGSELKTRAKEFGMQLLQMKVNDREFVFSTRDMELVSELERTTYIKTKSGEIVYRTMSHNGGFSHSDDHNVAALICYVLALYLQDELGGLQQRHIHLYRPRWSF